jgi:hypothetical protein
MREYTYENYLYDLDCLEENLLNEIALPKVSIRGKIGGIISAAHKTISKVGMSIIDVVRAFKDKAVFKLLKYFGFSLVKILKAINDATTFVHDKVARMFQELHKTKVFKKIESGAMKIDDVLNKYPILKKLTGPVVAGLLIYTWLNMTFIGNFNYDMDIGHWFDALVGNYSIYEYFASPQGNTMLLFLATGILSGGMLSVAWLGATHANLAVAITYSALKKTKANPKAVKKIEKLLGRKGLEEMKSYNDIVSLML